MQDQYQKEAIMLCWKLQNADMQLNQWKSTVINTSLSKIVIMTSFQLFQLLLYYLMT